MKQGYKGTSVGIIPEDWECVTLKDVCECIIDGTHQTPKYSKTGIPFYSVENITANNFSKTKYISDEEHHIITKRFKDTMLCYLLIYIFV